MHVALRGGDGNDLRLRAWRAQLQSPAVVGKANEVKADGAERSQA